MRRSIGVAAAVAILLTGCSRDTSEIDAACDAVAAAAALGDIEVDVLLAERARYDEAVELLDAAHRATDELSGRQRRRLVENCASVTDHTWERLRQRNSQRVAVDLLDIESRIAAAADMMAFAAEREQQADEEYERTASIACTSLEKARTPDADNALWVLSDLEDVVFRQRLWTDRHWQQFRSDCPLGTRTSVDNAVRNLTRVVEAQRQDRARSDANEMIVVLAQMEMAWNSISSTDRAVVCGRFRQDGVGTAQEWVRLSGYGRPEYAFAFLSQVC